MLPETGPLDVGASSDRDSTAATRQPQTFVEQYMTALFQGGSDARIACSHCRLLEGLRRAWVDGIFSMSHKLVD